MRPRIVLVVAVLGAAVAGLVPARAANGPLQIWPLGDSITVGASAQPTPGGYRTSLDQLLTHAGVAHHFVGSWTANSSATLDLGDQAHHDGHGGYRIDQILADLDGVAHGSSDVGGHWLAGRRSGPTLAPDAVLVHLGTNDILQRWDTRRFPTRDRRADLGSAAQRAVFVADMTTRLADLVLRLHSLRPRALVVVATIVPIDLPSFGDTAAAYADSVRTLLARLAARHVPVVLADAYAAFVTAAPPGGRVAPGLLCTDGVHPGPAGYTLLARVFASALEGRTLPVSVSAGERP